MSKWDLLLWALVIAVICYIFGLNPITIIGDLANAAHAAHNAVVNGNHR